jgi:hypothetical protein
MTGSTEAEQIAAAQYVRQQRVVRSSAERAQAFWRRLRLTDIEGSWQAVVAPGLLTTVTAAQQEAASHADAYVAAILTADGLDSDPSGKLAASRFAGAAADGRPLKSLFYESVLETRWLVEEADATDVEAMIGGLEKLLRAVSTEVADAGRTATGVSIAGNRTINGYIRVVNPPACSRCLILAGKEFGWNTGFQRHPKCDCIHLPAKLIKRGRGHPGVTDVRGYFNGLSTAEQDRLFTKAGAQAIRDGASPASVVNARRGMYTADAYGRRVRATHDSVTRRGLWFQQERRRAIQRGLVPRSGQGFRLKSPRLLPEEIYRLAGSRSEAIAMLHRFGYMT